MRRATAVPLQVEPRYVGSSTDRIDDHERNTIGRPHTSYELSFVVLQSDTKLGKTVSAVGLDGESRNAMEERGGILQLARRYGNLITDRFAAYLPVELSTKCENVRRQRGLCLIYQILSRLTLLLNLFR